MKYKTLCRLLIRLMGIFFIGTGIVNILSATGDVLFNLALGATQRTWAYHGWYVGIRVLSGLPVGLYLYARAGWLTDRLIPSNRPYCHECGYDLTGTVDNLCSECGTEFKPRQVLDVEPHH